VKDAGRLEVAQAIHEQVRADAGQRVEELAVASRRAEELAHDQERPAFADDVEGGGESGAVAVAAPPGRCRTDRMLARRGCAGDPFTISFSSLLLIFKEAR
jgi:hypothetical protein